MKSLRSFNISSKVFQSTKSFELTELDALETVEIGENCFNSADSFALIGRTEYINWCEGFPQLQSVRLGGNAFKNTKSFEMSNLTALQFIDIGQNCFGGDNGSNGASSFSLIGNVKYIHWRIDLPHLQSVKLNNNAFQYTGSFEMSNLTSLQSIDIGQNCFNGASSFSLIGMIERLLWIIDLPQLQLVKLGSDTHCGASQRKTKEEYPYNYNNTMIMKSRIGWGMGWNRSPVTDVIHRKWQQLHVFRFGDSGEYLLIDVAN